MWKNLKFSAKVSLLVTVFIIFSMITAFGYHTMSNKIRDIGIENTTTAMLDGYKNELKDIIGFTARSLASSTKGITDPKELYDIYSAQINESRFFPDESGYMFIYNGHKGFIHPVKPELIEGKNWAGLKDKNDVYIIKDLFEEAKKGGGFVEYLWEKPGKGVLPKLSYAAMIPDSDYWIGTGVYIDDIQAREAEITSAMNEFSESFLIKLYSVLAAIFFLIIVPLTLYMIKSMVLPLISLTETAQEYSRGKLENEFFDTDRQDEIGALARSVKRLGKSTKIVMKKLEEQL